MQLIQKFTQWRLSKLFVQMVLCFALLMVFFMGILFGVYQTAYMREYEETIKLNARNSVALIASRVDQSMSGISQQVMQLASNNVNLRSMKSISTSNLYRHYGLFLNEMDLIVSSNDCIDMLFYYQAQNDTIMDTNLGIVLIEDYEHQTLIQEVLNSATRNGWIRVGRSGAASWGYLLKMPLYSYATTDSFIFVSVNANLIEQQVLPLNLMLPNAAFYILDERGGQLYATKAGSSLPGEALDALFESGADTVRSIQRTGEDGNEMLLLSSPLSSGGYLVASIPLEWAAYARTQLSGTLSIISLCVTAAGIALAVLFSIRLSYPVISLVKSAKRLSEGHNVPMQKRYVDEFSYLQSALDDFSESKVRLEKSVADAQSVISSLCMRAVLEGKTSYTGSGGQLHDIAFMHLPQSSRLIVMSLQVELKNAYSAYQDADRPMAIAQVRRIVSQLALEDVFSDFQIVFQDLFGFSIILFYPAGAQGEYMLKTACQYAQKCSNAVRDALNVALIIGVGSPCMNPMDASISYDGARSALYCHSHTGEGGTVHVYEEREDVSENHMYPVYLEKELISQLNRSSLEGADRAFEAFLQSVQSTGSYLFMSQSCKILFATLLRNFSADKQNVRRILETPLYAEMDRCHTGQMLRHWMHERLFPLLIEINAPDTPHKLHAAIEEVLRYIDQNVTTDISLVQCAESVNLSPGYLSSIIRKESGKTFTEHVTMRKIAYAKRRLLSTELAVNEIAQEIGYSERNLYRLFVKQEGISPGAFRNTYKQ